MHQSGWWAACGVVTILCGCGQEPSGSDKGVAKEALGIEPDHAQIDGGTAVALQTPTIDEISAAEMQPELDQALQQIRKDEVADRVARVHAEAGRLVVLTQVLETGTVVDWVDRSTVQGADAQEPPPLKLNPLPSGVKRAEFEKLYGPPGTLPYVRPSFEPYVKGQTPARDLEEYIRKLPTGHPAEGGGGTTNRLYASNSTNQTNFGANAQVNNFWVGMQWPILGEFAISEIAVYCRASGVVTDLVGVVLGRLPNIYSGAVFGVERFISGAGQWVTSASANGFVQTNPNWAPGINITGSYSVYNGAQYENQVGVYFFNAAGSSTPGWWVTLNGSYIGYFPPSLFTSLNSSACKADFYGEMYDGSSATTDWMNADMTSGFRPPGSSVSTNFGKAGYFRLPIIVTTVNNAFGIFPSANSALLGINHAYCYDGRWTTDGSPSSFWNPTLWVGGPGGNGFGCNADPGGSFGFQPQNGPYVCSPGCTQCGGTGCGSAGTQPGDLCCGNNIGASGRDCSTDFAPCKIMTADPECRTGLLHTNGTYCCGGGCTQCGGNGCGNAGTGCCTGSITQPCTAHMPACKITPPPANP